MRCENGEEATSFPGPHFAKRQHRQYEAEKWFGNNRSQAKEKQRLQPHSGSVIIKT
jgi:hypothetical protein